MQFLEALELAQEIYRRCPTWEILAIGRFVPIDQIHSGDTWKISVLARGQDRPRIIRSSSDFDRLRNETFGGDPVAALPLAPAGMLF